jgi:hypothetical protein
MRLQAGDIFFYAPVMTSGQDEISRLLGVGQFVMAAWSG